MVGENKRKQEIIEIKEQHEKLSKADKQNIHQLSAHVVNLGNELNQVTKETINDLCHIEVESAGSIQINFIEASINRTISRLNGLALSILTQNLLSTDPIMKNFK